MHSAPLNPQLALAPLGRADSGNVGFLFFVQELKINTEYSGVTERMGAFCGLADKAPQHIHDPPYSGVCEITQVAKGIYPRKLLYEISDYFTQMHHVFDDVVVFVNR